MALTDTANITAAYSDPNFLNTIEKNVTNTTGGKKDEGNIESLRYPLKIIDAKTDYIRMGIYEYEPAGFKEVGTILKSLLEAQENKSNNQIIKNPDGSTTTIEKGLVSEFSDKLKSISNATNGKEKSKAKPKTQIILPIPGNLSDTNSVGWGEDRLNPFAMLGASAVSEVMENPTEALAKLKTNLEGVTGVKASTVNAATAALAASAVNTFGGNVSASGLISRATGQVFNPNLELLFQGPNLRVFPFTFDFAPRSQKEGEMVKKIIRTLKKSMFSKKNQQSDSSVFLSAPDVFLIEYRKGGSKHPFLNTFKQAALTDMQINYTGSGPYATYHDGTPVHIQVTLTFKELNPIYAEDYDEATIGVGY